MLKATQIFIHKVYLFLLCHSKRSRDFLRFHFFEEYDVKMLK